MKLGMDEARTVAEHLATPDRKPYAATTNRADDDGGVTMNGVSEDPSWLRSPMTDTAQIAARYDEWAQTYERELVREWRYQAPAIAARHLADAGVVNPVLDVGCGTGLVGRFLREAGFDDIDGVDVSPASLDTARASGVYRELSLADFNSGTLPFPDSAYAAVICVGVLSYAVDPGAVVEEFCRITQPDGQLVLTHRVDLWEAQDFGGTLLALQESGVLRDVVWTEPSEYMPGNEALADIRIRYVTATVTNSVEP